MAIRLFGLSAVLILLTVITGQPVGAQTVDLDSLEREELEARLAADEDD